MRRPNRLLAAFCLLLAASAPGTANTDAERLAQYLEGLQSFSAAFEQTLMDESGQELERSSGVVHISRPGRFRWAYQEPFPQLIVSDGRTLWIHDQDLEQVTIRDVADSIEDSPAALLGGDVDIPAHYVVIELGETEGVQWLELTPRDIDAEYGSVRLGFRDGEPAGMVLFDNLGQKTRISFHDVRRNPVLDPELFTFTPPPGVDVIDER